MFKAADLTKDVDLLQSAIEDVEAILSADPRLKLPPNQPLMKAVEAAHPLALK